MSLFSTKHTLASAALVAGALTVPLGCRGVIGLEERELLEKVSCENYCDVIQTECTGDNAQFASNEVCLAMCATFEKGTESDVEVDTLGCRVRVLETVSSTHEVALCKSLGPSGEGTCGSSCTTYCRSLEALCPTQFATYGGDCASQCGGFSNCGGYVADAERNDDSLQCRIFHLTSAALDAATHCKHAIADGHCFEATLSCSTTQ